MKKKQRDREREKKKHTNNNTMTSEKLFRSHFIVRWAHFISFHYDYNSLCPFRWWLKRKKKKTTNILGPLSDELDNLSLRFVKWNFVLRKSVSERDNARARKCGGCEVVWESNRHPKYGYHWVVYLKDCRISGRLKLNAKSYTHARTHKEKGKKL